MRSWKKSLAIVVLGSIVIIQSCNKKDDLLTDDTLEQTEISKDQISATNEVDRAFDDINNLVSTSRTVGGRLEDNLAIELPCGAQIDSTQNSKRRLVLTFKNDIPCREATIVRSGSISIQLKDSTSRWRDMGCVLEATFNNYMVRSIRTNSFIIINGTKTITNESGGLVRFLPLNPSAAIIHKIAASFTINFNDVHEKSWQLSQKRKTTLGAVTLIGDGTFSGQDKVRIQGINKNGYPFYSRITEDIIIPKCNDTWKPISGKMIDVTIKGQKTNTLEITYGVKSDGGPASGCFELFGYRLNWKNDNNQAKEVIVAY